MGNMQAKLVPKISVARASVHELLYWQKIPSTSLKLIFTPAYSSLLKIGLCFLHRHWWIGELLFHL